MLTTREIADALGLRPRRVLELAQLRNIKPARRVGSAWLWHDTAVMALRPRPRPGRPRKAGQCG